MNDITSNETLSRTIGAIYDSALDQALWPAALQALCGAMNFRMASLVVAALPSRRALIDITTGIEEEQRARMLAQSEAAVDAWGPPGTLAALPLEAPLIRSIVNPAAAMSSYVREQCVPLGFIDNLSIVLSRDRHSFCVLSFNRHIEDGPIGKHEVATARLFTPHLKRALVIGQLLQIQQLERTTYRTVLDALAFAVLLVGSDMQLLHANLEGRTLLRRGGPLGLRSGIVTAEADVAEALSSALAPGPEIAGQRLAVPAHSATGEEIVIHVLPLGSERTRGVLPGAAGALFVAPASTQRPAPISAIASLFDLTSTEARVLERLAAGLTMSEVAETLGISNSTSRTHLMHLFHKTWTHRQASLLALVSAFSLPLR